MRYRALACDYDGTLAHHGKVDEPTRAALRRFLDSGRRLLLVSGRELPDLLSTCPHTELFELLVLENGGLLYWPDARIEKPLGPPPSERFIAALREHNIPVSVGRVIVATWEPHEHTVLQVIRNLGLELEIVFNKGAVMVLPTGINKATGLRAALNELDLTPEQVVGVGDAENDHAFLHLCGTSVAVANALPAVKRSANYVTKGDHGAGVAELIAAILADDLSVLPLPPA
jgi:hydroxymethylpyrimidine pyrophosphatase-like HAD family hydrolase